MLAKVRPSFTCPNALNCQIHMATKHNLVPRAFSSIKMVGRRNPWPRLPIWLQNFIRISSRKHEMSSFRLKNGFRLQKTNRAAIRWKQPPTKPLHHVPRDKILYDSWSISAALARPRRRVRDEVVPNTRRPLAERVLGKRLISSYIDYTSHVRKLWQSL